MQVPTQVASNTLWVCAPNVTDASAFVASFVDPALWRIRALSNANSAGPLSEQVSQLHETAYAALRWFDESAQPSLPLGYIAAFDPVCMQADMRDVRIMQTAAGLLSEEEADSLAATVSSLMAEDPDPRIRRVRLERCNPHHWYLRGEEDAALALDAANPQAILGMALRDCSATGDDARLLKRLVTEIEMSWHEHPVNKARSARGVASVNSVWLHGAGVLTQPPKPMSLPVLNTDSGFARGVWRALDSQAQIEDTSALVAGGQVLVLESSSTQAQQRQYTQLKALFSLEDDSPPLARAIVCTRGEVIELKIRPKIIRLINILKSKARK